MTSPPSSPHPRGGAVTLDDIIRQIVEDPVLRDILVFLYSEQPEGAEFEALKEALFLHEGFDPLTLRSCIAQRVLKVHEGRYQLTDKARAVLAAHPEFLQ